MELFKKSFQRCNMDGVLVGELPSVAEVPKPNLLLIKGGHSMSKRLLKAIAEESKIFFKCHG